MNDRPLEATTADAAALTAAMSNAFADDPVAAWAAPWLAQRRRMLDRFFANYLRHKVPLGFVHCDDARLGAAIWAPPGSSKPGAGETIGVLRSGLFARNLPRVPWLLAGLLALDRRHPKQEHFYLAALGVDPSAQGQGLGRRLLDPVLEICDTDRVGAYLESSNPANVDFYVRCGFKVTGQVTLPRGPTVDLMWRDPA